MDWQYVILALAAMGMITFLEWAALQRGINGSQLRLVVAVLAIIAGGAVGQVAQQLLTFAG